MQSFNVAVLTALIPAFINMVTASPAPAPAVKPREISLDLEKRFTPGRCGVHVTQYSNPAGINIVVSDNGATIIGNLLSDFNGLNAIDVDSQLPYVIVVSKDVTDDELQFAYGGDNWSTTDGRCSVGGWDNDARQMDCGFAC